MQKHVLIFSDGLSGAQKGRLAQRYVVHDFSDRDAGADNPDFAAALAQAHGLIGVRMAWSAQQLARAQALEAVSSISVGVDNYDVDYLSTHGITLCHTPDVLTETTADTAFTLMLTSARRAVELANRVRAGEWRAPVGPAEYGVDVHHKRLGIVGMGRIGAAIARRAHFGFGMSVSYHNRSRAPALEAELGAEYVTFDALLEHSDFVCATVPLSAATENLFDAAAFARMKHSAIFINIARGGVVDEAALVAALDNGDIRAAGLDVFRDEPIDGNHPLASRDNVVALPHIGSATFETRAAMADLAVDNLIAALEGDTPAAVFKR
ncbi:2-hydroxyacid dehydrogenase [Salinisphaera aquimarina]|uniref:2-hydroxyacid dehydrogenase n=1 Tax=Salinisphaera aquimarina TaxID=2094031 RepID=A0ABV7EPW0_9GAMM